MTGRARIRAGSETFELGAGEVILHPPGEAHQTFNPASEDLVVLIIADNPPNDTCYYPDSDKHGSRDLGINFRIQPVDYFDGEE